MTLRRGFVAALCASGLTLSACGGDTSGRATPTGSPATTASSSAAAAELTDETLSALERGLRREIQAVKVAQQRSREAKTAQERGEAIQASFEDATMLQGAETAGMPIEQYRAVRHTVDQIFRTLDVQGKIDGPISMDLTRVDEAAKQRLLRDPFEDLSAASAASLRAHMDRLVPIWIDYVNLTAVAG